MSADNQQLKARAHNLKPIILVGNKGVTEAVNKEIDRALQDHELIKIRIQSRDREERYSQFVEICQIQQANFVQMVGMVGTIYRKNKDK